MRTKSQVDVEGRYPGRERRDSRSVLLKFYFCVNKIRQKEKKKNKLKSEKYYRHEIDQKKVWSFRPY